MVGEKGGSQAMPASEALRGLCSVSSQRRAQSIPLLGKVLKEDSILTVFVFFF